MDMADQTGKAQTDSQSLLQPYTLLAESRLAHRPSDQNLLLAALKALKAVKADFAHPSIPAAGPPAASASPRVLHVFDDLLLDMHTPILTEDRPQEAISVAALLALSFRTFPNAALEAYPAVVGTAGGMSGLDLRWSELAESLLGDQASVEWRTRAETLGWDAVVRRHGLEGGRVGTTTAEEYGAMPCETSSLTSAGYVTRPRILGISSSYGQDNWLTAWPCRRAQCVICGNSIYGNPTG
jgi:hypothetical protein